MPFRYIVAFCFLAPLIGIMQMGGAGAYGGSVLQVGHPNGATVAFGIGLLAFLVAVVVASELELFSFAGLRQLPLPEPSSRIWILATVSLLAMAFFTLFVSGGIHVMLRSVGRGDFRAGLGDTGAVSYLILKYYSPALLAYLALLYSRRPWYDAIVPLGLPAILVALISLSFGFNSGMVLALLPAAVVYVWRTSGWWVVPLAALPLVLISVGYSFFEGLFDPADILGRLVSG